MNVSPYYIYVRMKTKMLPKSGGHKDVRSSQFRYGKVAEQRAVNRFLTAKSLTPHSRLSLSSRYGRVIVRVLSADEIKEKQKQGRQIAVLGKMADVTPRVAFAQARKVTATGELPQIPIPTFTPFPGLQPQLPELCSEAVFWLHWVTKLHTVLFVPMRHLKRKNFTQQSKF
ncbi:hypothetical protein SFC43_05340 [Bacteroides sp. CR5/BHMF/2]|nr:hypothetical protein [Bacteroides sp. CR5/BHMF/2]